MDFVNVGGEVFPPIKLDNATLIVDTIEFEIPPKQPYALDGVDRWSSSGIKTVVDPPKLSRGQEIAEKQITYDGNWVNFLFAGEGDRDFGIGVNSPKHTAKEIREHLASAIDAAIAEERERCAKVVEAWPQIMDGRFVLSTRIRSPE
jgi:hypothetical protein